MSPLLFSRLLNGFAPGYPGDEDKAREQFAKLDQAKSREDFVAAAHWARGVAGGNGKLGAVGFCYGGGMVNLLAVRVPELLAGVPFYGGPAPADQAGQIKAELVLILPRTTSASTPPGRLTRRR